MNKSFLKFAGGKAKTLQFLSPHFSDADVFIEPFCGSGVVWLNTDYKKYIIADINADLINLFNILKTNKNEFITYAQQFFAEGNVRETYYKNRAAFNTTTDPTEKAALFVYLNRHCFNGLCRYNKSGKFNVPFGRYKTVYFPKKEMQFFIGKAENAEFHCLSFEQTFALANKNSVVYCDPPYMPISKTSSFTAYAKNKFEQAEQKSLLDYILACPGKVIVSNSKAAKKMYAPLQIHNIKIKRNISANKTFRVMAEEIIGIKE